MKLSYLSLILVLSCACGQPGQEMYPDIADAARTSFCVASMIRPGEDLRLGRK